MISYSCMHYYRASIALSSSISHALMELEVAVILHICQNESIFHWHCSYLLGHVQCIASGVLPRSFS
jgi:hypothetical protein